MELADATVPPTPSNHGLEGSRIGDWMVRDWGSDHSTGKREQGSTGTKVQGIGNREEQGTENRVKGAGVWSGGSVPRPKQTKQR